MATVNDLSAAILANDTSTAAALINNGIEINARDQYGSQPLIQAVIKENITVVKLLLENGANVDERDIAGSSALSWAAGDNQLEICKLLLTHGASPNLYDTSGQPLLANVRLRDQQELITLLVENGADIAFAKDYITAKTIGHRFELTGKANIVNANGNFVEVNFEGFTTEFTIGLIRKSLIAFGTSHIGKEFAEYTHYLDKIIAALEVAQNFVPPIYKRRHHEHALRLEPFLKNQLLIIPITYHGHAISMVKYGDLLAKCDRGVNNITDTTIIYRAQNPYRLNNTLIKRLIYEHNTEQFIHHELREQLALAAFATLPTRSQISGNCSWANIEAGAISALFLLKHAATQINTELRSADKFKVTAIKRTVMSFYDAWVDWDKDRALNDCILEFMNASSAARRTSKAVIMASILFQRC